MTPELISLVLAALAAVVIVLTRVRLARAGQARGRGKSPGKSRGKSSAAGRLDIPDSLVNLHTGAGLVALVAWVWFLLAHKPWTLGLVGVFLWWCTAGVGMLILVRWLPAKGRHASGPASDAWGAGPALSVLGHVGLVLGCVVWTWFLAVGKV